jgi:hypothetical protein
MATMRPSSADLDVYTPILMAFGSACLWQTHPWIAILVGFWAMVAADARSES